MNKLTDIPPIMDNELIEEINFLNAAVRELQTLYELLSVRTQKPFDMEKLVKDASAAGSLFREERSYTVSELREEQNSFIGTKGEHHESIDIFIDWLESSEKETE
jgi:hypothetical protein